MRALEGRQTLFLARQRRAHPLAYGLVGLALSWAFASVGCLYDSKHRCGERQVYLENVDLCACAEGYGLIDGVCQKCAEHERALAALGCTCEVGYARDSATGSCVKADIGKPCTSDTDCGGGDLTCHFPTSTDGYCTQTGCAQSSDCGATDYQCNRDGPVTFCQRPPTGMRSPCASDADCAGFEANHCEVINRKFCIVGGCASNPNICPPDEICCDILASRRSVCVATEALINGSCPGGGSIVPRTGGAQ